MTPMMMRLVAAGIALAAMSMQMKLRAEVPAQAFAAPVALAVVR
jgi:hypothetical protein